MPSSAAFASDQQTRDPRQWQQQVQYESTVIQVQGKVKSQDNGAGDHLGLHDVLSLQIVVGSDEGCICPDTRERPPA